jgi:hypothetical protein
VFCHESTSTVQDELKSVELNHRSVLLLPRTNKPTSDENQEPGEPTMRGIRERQRTRFVSLGTALGLGVAVLVGTSVVNSPSAAAVDQQLTITQLSSQYGAPGVTVRRLRVTNEVGQPVAGVALFGGNGGQQGGGNGPFCFSGRSDAGGNLELIVNSSQLCGYTVAYTGSYSPFTGVGADGVSWPITFPALPPQPLPLTTPTRTAGGVPVFVRETGDAVVTSQTNAVTYGSPTNTPYSLRALFGVQSRQADIFVPFNGVADADVLVEYRNAAGAVVGGARCVGVACVRTPFAAPAGATTLYISLKATGPVTINPGYVDWLGSSVAPIVSGGPTLPATTSTVSASTTPPSTIPPSTTPPSTTPPSTIATGVIDVTQQFFNSGLSGRLRDPLGNYYTVIPKAANRLYTDFQISCEGADPIRLNIPAAGDGSGALACSGEANRVNVITISDKLGVYPPAIVRWYPTFPVPPRNVFAGEDQVFFAPEWATNVGINVGTCEGTRCVVPGSVLQPNFNPLAVPSFFVSFRFDGAPGVIENRLLVGPPQTTTTGPTTTVAEGLKLDAPTSAVFGSPITVIVSGATPSTGRIDLSIGGGSVGSLLVNSGGSATFTVTPWVLGSTTITADWVRYIGGKAVTTTMSVPLVVSLDGVPVTSAPPTTGPVTTAPPTTVPGTTAPPSSGPPTTIPSTGPVTTVPPAGVLQIAAPPSVAVGTNVTIRVTGATPSTGRIDLRIGTGSAGSLLVDSTGGVTFNVSAWVLGQTTLTADWVRYENGKPITVSATIPLTVTR